MCANKTDASQRQPSTTQHEIFCDRFEPNQITKTKVNIFGAEAFHMLRHNIVALLCPN